MCDTPLLKDSQDDNILAVNSLAATKEKKGSGNGTDQAPESEPQTLSKFDNLRYFLIHELQFCAMFTLEQGWVRSDNIFGSMVINAAGIPALGQLYIIISMIDCFCFGYGFATTSMMTN